MTRVLGKDLRPGMGIDGVTIVGVRPYLVPAAVLHDYYATRYPDGMPGRLVSTMPSCKGFTAFDDEGYEVTP